MNPDLTPIFMAGTAILAGLTFVTAKAWPVIRRLVHFQDDMMGRPGFPGIFERLEGIEKMAAEVRHEVRHNDGSSLKDAVRRIEVGLRESHGEIVAEMDRHQAEDAELAKVVGEEISYVRSLGDRVSNIEALLERGTE